MATMKTASLLALTTAVSGAVLELPVFIQNTYSSVQFEIGTPPKPYRFLFDTGSSTTWMTGTNCTEESCPNFSGYTRKGYNLSDSSTAVDLELHANIPYIDGDGVLGRAIQDVFIAPEGASPALEWNQTFLAVNQSSWRFITADGFMGLGFSSIAENGTSSLVETLLWDGQLDEPRFSLFYGTDLTDDGPKDGVLTIGGSHEDKYVDGEVVYAPLRKEDPYQLWRAPLRSVSVLVAAGTNQTVKIDNGKMPTTTDPEGTYPIDVTWPTWGGGRAVFDTGAGRISLPPEMIAPIYFNLGWNVTKLYAGEERMECQHLNASWAITLTLGEEAEENDVSFTIRGDEFTRPGSQCMPPIDDSEVSGFALIGGAFLRRFYTIHDFGASKVEEYKPRIGFGRLKKEYDYLYQ
ncbi:acid protease [Corynespora cassiicola Philippines]|uniref:Acid protease n=1 Tax=Corynespora cassiicola Philippines TaxID=1448308 RepID=A0A2T2P016_CORCC|nr:acid protease [Corynespora cassiicola Philippines]